MNFILASSNLHKSRELGALLVGGGVSIEAAPEKLEVVEDGSSFQENAYKKAKAYFDYFKQPTLSDDSGLVLPSRPDILGIHSASYAEHLREYKDKNEHLINEIKDLEGEKRQAYFACYLCFYISESEIYYFEGRVHGEMAKAPLGRDGFGYDPIFLPKGQGGKSMAQVSEWKMKNSHRAKACIAASDFFYGRGAKLDL